MANQYTLEDIRAWAEGRLDAEARGSFERELASDAELRSLAEAYSDVHQLSQGEAVAVPASQLEYASVAGDLEEWSDGPVMTLPRLIAVAASLVAMFGITSWWGSRDQLETNYEPVNLLTIPLTTQELSSSPELPATLASYHPVSNGEIQWVRETEEADRLASATGRPLLVFGRYAKCQVADGVEESMTVDAELQELAEQCVPVIVELDEMEEVERDLLVADGYPSIQLRSADGSATVCVTKDTVGCDLKERIRRGIGACGMSGRCGSWEDSRQLAALCEKARIAEAEGRMAEAHRAYEQLVAGGGPGLLSEVGQRGLLRIALAARDSLLDARAMCEQDPAGAERLLEQAVERFENTPHVAELVQVLVLLRRSGSFPMLAWATS